MCVLCELEKLAEEKDIKVKAEKLKLLFKNKPKSIEEGLTVRLTVDANNKKLLEHFNTLIQNEMKRLAREGTEKELNALGLDEEGTLLIGIRNIKEIK